jgi:EAL domain-containing protein (putative c-di-GMP-specific phosphodiesterase class I)/FixJ family two-component response regulator
MLKLLMVDDDARVCTVVGRIAKRAGVDFYSLNDPSRFQQVCDEVQPDLLFLDIKMPNMDGIQLLRQMKYTNSSIPVYILSGLAHNLVHSAKIIGEESKLNIKGYIEKPIDVDQLMRIFEQDYAPVASSNAKDAQEAPVTVTPRDLEAAIANNEIFVQYQPKVSLKTGHVVGVEALARWVSPQLGKVGADVFVGCAETSGLIDKLTTCIGKVIVRDAKLIFEQHPDVRISMNVSPAMLHSLEFPDEMEALVKQNGLSSESFILEITETADPKDYNDFLESMTRLRLKGFELALDDFGTGNSSTLQLFYLPISELKLDKRFINRITESEQARIIIRSTLELARSFGVSITAEGIENYNTLKWLSDEGCPIGQGFFISRPLDLQKLLKFTQLLESSSVDSGVIEATPLFQRGLGLLQ